ncbi:MAG: hypothetical protein KAG97_07835, partial [Victivallales bacterium]|nr:hypothetical protein [Victivallales bacterium]
AFRRAENNMPKGCFRLRELSEDSTYEFENADTGDIFCETGENLMNSGFDIDIPNQQESRLYFYRVPNSESRTAT